MRQRTNNEETSLRKANVSSSSLTLYAIKWFKLILGYTSSEMGTVLHVRPNLGPIQGQLGFWREVPYRSADDPQFLRDQLDWPCFLHIYFLIFWGTLFIVNGDGFLVIVMTSVRYCLNQIWSVLTLCFLRLLWKNESERYYLYLSIPLYCTETENKLECFIKNHSYTRVLNLQLPKQRNSLLQSPISLNMNHDVSRE